MRFVESPGMREAELVTGKTIKLHDAGEFISDNIYASKRYFEMDSLVHIAKTCRPNSVVDIGANLGNHSMFFSRELGIETYAFEPCRRNFELLKVNAPSAKSFNLALSDEIGTSVLATFESCLGNNTLHSLWDKVPAWGDGIKEEVVSVVRLDQFHIPEIDLIKIDVEGAELRVLMGATCLLERQAPILCIELHKDENLRRAGFEYSRSDIFAFLGNYGYSLVEEDRYGNHIFRKQVRD